MYIYKGFKADVILFLGRCRTPLASVFKLCLSGKLILEHELLTKSLEILFTKMLYYWGTKPLSM